MKEVSSSERTLLVMNYRKKKWGVSVFSRKWSSSENNTGGIWSDRKREVKGFFFMKWGTNVHNSCWTPVRKIIKVLCTT